MRLESLEDGAYDLPSLKFPPCVRIRNVEEGPSLPGECVKKGGNKIKLNSSV